MKKIVLYYGSNRSYAEILPKSYRNLSSVAMQLDDEGKKFQLVLPQQQTDEIQEKKIPKEKINNFCIFADEYGSVQEHVIINFAGILAKLDVNNMYIQNPPSNLRDQIMRLYAEEGMVEEKHQEYELITSKKVKDIYLEYNSRIIGQEVAKMDILKCIYPLVDNVQTKPVVLLFYGKSGLGKTETANFITEKIGGSLLRKQFSMFQSGEFANYLFGGRYNEKSFAKDLVSRDSNVILLDEFDKANPVFHSAFYQLFDEGTFEDPNYKVDVRHAIIICTSNYTTKEEIKEQLGIAIYNRFDGIIRFEDLSSESKMQIALKEIKALDTENVLSSEIRESIIQYSQSMENVREIRRVIKDSISLIQVRRICE